MTRGFVDSGRFEPVLAVESDPEAAATYELNFGPHVARDRGTGRPAKIEDIHEFPEVDVVIGGPPCQGFSTLNMRRAGLDRRGLWQHYVRAIEQTRPYAFVMENVPQLLRSAEYADFRKAIEQLEDLDFETADGVLNAADYGVPQTRRRAIVVGARAAAPMLPAPTFCDPARPEPGKQAWRDFRWAVRGLPLTPNGSDWHNPRNPTKLSMERYRAIPGEGEGRSELARRRRDITPRCWLEKKTGSTDVFGRLWWDRPAFTIRTEFYKPEKGRYLHPAEHRSITVREAARCMSFPDDFEFFPPGVQSMTSVARQIGNAVPPLLARAIAASIAGTLDAHVPAERPRRNIARKHDLAA